MDARATEESRHFLGRAPFGYLIVGDLYLKHLVVDETKRALVGGVFEKAINGSSLRDIAAWLRAHGVEGRDQGGSSCRSSRRYPYIEHGPRNIPDRTAWPGGELRTQPRASRSRLCAAVIPCPARTFP